MGTIQPIAMGDLYNRFLVPPGKIVKLSEYDPAETCGFKSEEEVKELLDYYTKRLKKLIHTLFAEKQYALLIVVQGMDGSGKDGVIKHLVKGLTTEMYSATHFKVPTKEEQTYDFLKRIHLKTPRKGKIRFFHRSQYEDVVVVHAKGTLPKDVLERRYDHINNFEKLLADSNTIILKFFLNISNPAQLEKITERFTNPDKRWKHSPEDIVGHMEWDQNMEAYGEAITRCNNIWAPWLIIPSDNQWFRDLAAGQIVVSALENIYPQNKKNATSDEQKIAS